MKQGDYCSGCGGKILIAEIISLFDWLWTEPNCFRTETIIYIIGMAGYKYNRSDKTAVLESVHELYTIDGIIHFYIKQQYGNVMRTI